MSLVIGVPSQMIDGHGDDGEAEESAENGRVHGAELRRKKRHSLITNIIYNEKISMLLKRDDDIE